MICENHYMRLHERMYQAYGRVWDSGRRTIALGIGVRWDKWFKRKYGLDMHGYFKLVR